MTSGMDLVLLKVTHYRLIGLMTRHKYTEKSGYIEEGNEVFIGTVAEFCAMQ